MALNHQILLLYHEPTVLMVYIIPDLLMMEFPCISVMKQENIYDYWAVKDMLAYIKVSKENALNLNIQMKMKR